MIAILLENFLSDYKWPNLREKNSLKISSGTVKCIFFFGIVIKLVNKSFIFSIYYNEVLLTYVYLKLEEVKHELSIVYNNLIYKFPINSFSNRKISFFLVDSSACNFPMFYRCNNVLIQQFFIT